MQNFFASQSSVIIRPQNIRFVESGLVIAAGAGVDVQNTVRGDERLRWEFQNVETLGIHQDVVLKGNIFFKRIRNCNVFTLHVHQGEEWACVKLKKNVAMVD